MIVLKYVEIRGTVGDTKIDLQLGIPVEEIIKSLPTFMDMLIDVAPSLKKKFEESAKRINEFK